VNTSAKIQTLEELQDVLQQGEWTILFAQFDPLTPDIASRLNSLVSPGRKLLVIIPAVQDQFLPLQARAILAASLRGVDAVAVAPPAAWRESFSSNPAIRIVDDSAADARRSSEFTTRVLQRQEQAKVST
jgi:hypothetical protein